MRKKLLLGALAVVIAGLAIAAIVVFRPKTSQAPARSGGAVALPAGSAGNLSGFLRAQHVVTFGTTLNGSIMAFLAEVGDQVFQNQVLARVGAGDLESARENAQRAVDKAQERVDSAQDDLNRAQMEESRSSADLQRAREVFEKADALYSKYKNAQRFKAVAKNVFDKSEQDYESARQEYEASRKSWEAAQDMVRVCQNVLDTAKQALQKRVEDFNEASRGMEATEIKAPVDGYLVARNGQVGQSAEEVGEQMFQIATDFAAMEFTVSPPADVLKKLAPGRDAVVLIPEMSDAAVPGKVKSVNGSEVVVEFVANLPALRPGLRATARF
jgi:multidrug resistance efflux pump